MLRCGHEVDIKKDNIGFCREITRVVLAAGVLGDAAATKHSGNGSAQIDRIKY